MAVKLEDGRYFRVDLDACYIDRRGIHIGYLEYPNDISRQEEQERETKLTNLLQNISDYIENNARILKDKFGENPEFKSETEFINAMTESEREMYIVIQQLNDDRNTIITASQVGDRTVEKGLKNIKLLNELGYSSELLDKLNSGENRISISGPLTNQKFTHADMYKELKKVFRKDRFTDC